MITIPLPQVIEKIKAKTGLTDEEIDAKIKAKMDQLSGLISKEGAAHIIANENGVVLVSATSGRLQIKNVLAGMRSVEVVGKVIQVYEVREFEREGRKGRVGNFLIADESGSIRIVAWGDKADILSKIVVGDIVKISDSYVKNNRDQNEIHLNDRSKLVINPEGETVNSVASTVQSRPAAERKSIKDLTPQDQNVEILGTVVQVFDPRFFVRKKDGEQSYVVNTFVDDGTDNIRVAFFGNQATKLLSLDNDTMLTFQENPSAFEDKKTEMLGQVIKVSGRANKNDMFDRLEMVANSVDPNPNPDEELKRLQ